MIFVLCFALLATLATREAAAGGPEGPGGPGGGGGGGPVGDPYRSLKAFQKLRHPNDIMNTLLAPTRIGEERERLSCAHMIFSTEFAASSLSLVLSRPNGLCFSNVLPALLSFVSPTLWTSSRFAISSTAASQMMPLCCRTWPTRRPTRGCAQ